MYLIQRFKNLVAELYIRTQRGLKLSLLVAYSIVFSLFLNAGIAFCDDSKDDWNRISGPISIVNQTPIQLLFLQPIPDRAETYPKNRYSISLTTAMSNTLLWQKTDHYFGYDDMEMIRTTLELKYGLLSRVEIDMSLPFVYGYGGILDHGIHEFEKLWFRSTRDIRDKEDRTGRINNYTFFVQKDGKTFIQGEERGSGLGDIPLTVKGKILDESDMIPCLSARVSVKIPTGDDKRALGSGKVDYGLGLLLQKTYKNFTTYLNADVTFPGQAFNDEDISLIPFYEIMLGGEYKFTQRLSGLLQLSYITRPFEKTGLVMLDDRMWYFTLGVSYLTKMGVYIQGGLIQDSFDSSDQGADITFFLNVGKNF
jgi:hypothetical protein